MLKVYIIAAIDNISFAEGLLSNVKNIKIISRPSTCETNSHFGKILNQKIESADIILAVIDNRFSENIFLNFEMLLAQMSVQKVKNKLLIPVVLDGANIPTNLEGTLYIACASNSKYDLYKAQLTIEKMLTHRYYNIRKNMLKKTSSRTFYMMILTLAIALFPMLFFALPFYNERSFILRDIEGENIIYIMLIATFTVSAFAVLLSSYLSIMKRRRQEDDEEELESYSRRLKRAIVSEETGQDEQMSSGNEEKKEIDALGRMMINLEDIKEFYTWSQKQAKASFILAVAMCASGFLLMIVAIILPVAFRLSFQTSIIPAIGGVITELIAGTALVVYRNSLSQLNHYHKALHEDERFLSSVNLLGKFSIVKNQDDMLREIIRSEIQMNLAGLQENENARSDKLGKKDNSEP